MANNWKKARDAYITKHPYCQFRLTTGVLCSKIAVDVHHRQHRSQGGGHEEDNLESTCRAHHMKEHGIKAV